jgi:two-component system cell cycle response regulator
MTVSPTPTPTPTSPLADLAEAAACVDPSFYAHAASVLALSTKVAAALRLADDDCRTVAVAAALHDIGKLAVPAGILDKPGPLADAEWAHVRAHPAEGERLLAEHVPEDVLRIVRSHHERWDGAGYPDRLAGSDIPVGARIVAVADAYTAMIEQRPYREARSAADATAELRRESGRQFDPACVDAALAVLG